MVATIRQHQDVEIPCAAEAGADLLELDGAGSAADEDVGVRMGAEVGAESIESVRCHGEVSIARMAMAMRGSSRSSAGMDSARDSGSTTGDVVSWSRTG